MAGDAGSEAADSEPAFVTCNSWETVGTYQNSGEGWMGNHETSSTSTYARPLTSTMWSPKPYGSIILWYTPFCGSNYMSYAGRWQGITKETPSVPDSTVRELTIGVYHFQTYSPTGLIIGTSSSGEAHNFVTSNIEWSSCYSTGDYYPYNTNSSDCVNWFDDVPSGQNNAWIYTSISRNRLYGGDCNAEGDPDDPYVVVEYAKSTAGSQPYPNVDELAIAIY